MVKSISSLDQAKKIRINAVKMVSRGGSSHIGAVLSCVDILAVLYSNIMNYKPEDPEWKLRDRFILSKGHAGAGVYATLASHGFFSTEDLKQHYINGSRFSGHVSHKNIPGVEFSTGSLGHGLPVAAGMALSAKMDNRSNRAFVLLGDGELVEGANWEAIFFAAHHKLNNLIVIIDRNNLQSITTTEHTIGLEPIKAKFEAFNWVVESVDGHNHEDLTSVLSQKRELKPLVVIAKTVKGKGVSFMENRVEWHYKYPNTEQFNIAIKELEKG